MRSSISGTFLDAVRAGIPAEHAGLLVRAPGAGPQSREFRRAYRLADESVQWAAEAVLLRAPEASNRLEPVRRLGASELGWEVAVRALDQARQHAGDLQLDGICMAVAEVGMALVRATARRSSRPVLDEFAVIARSAAGVLLAAGAIREDQWRWVAREANAAVAESRVGARPGRVLQADGERADEALALSDLDE